MNTVVAQAVDPREKTVVPQVEEVGLEGICDLLEQSESLGKLDLGIAIIHAVKHPSRGIIVLVTTVGERHAVIQC